MFACPLRSRFIPDRDEAGTIPTATVQERSARLLTPGPLDHRSRLEPQKPEDCLASSARCFTPAMGKELPHRALLRARRVVRNPAPHRGVEHRWICYQSIARLTSSSGPATEMNVRAGSAASALCGGGGATAAGSSREAPELATPCGCSITRVRSSDTRHR